MLQFLIAVFGLATVYMSLVSSSLRHKRLAPVVGLLGQPFWLYATYTGGQWGMFVLCIAYTMLYAVAAWKTYRYN